MTLTDWSNVDINTRAGITQNSYIIHVSDIIIFQACVKLTIPPNERNVTHGTGLN